MKKILGLLGIIVGFSSSMYPIQGPIEYRSKVIAEPVEVEGDFSGSALKLATLKVDGKTNLDKSVVSGKVTIAGDTDLLSSTFNGDVLINGTTNISKSVFNGKLTIGGTTVITNSAFKKPVFISGSRHIPGVESRDIADFTKIENSSFSGEATIVGSFEAMNTTFKAKHLTLIVEGDEPASFEQSVLNNLVIIAKDEESVPVVNLRKTLVKGSIRFNGAKGIVNYDQTSTVGSIENGSKGNVS